MLERDIEKWLGEQLRRVGCAWYKFVSPGNRGVPDRIAICPDGTVWFVELKKPTGRLAALQSVQLKRLARYGQRTALIRSMDDAHAFVVRIVREHVGRCAPRPRWEKGAQGATSPSEPKVSPGVAATRPSGRGAADTKGGPEDAL